MTNRFASSAATKRLMNSASQRKFAASKSAKHWPMMVSFKPFSLHVESGETLLRHGIAGIPQHFANFTREEENAVIIGQCLALE